MQDALSDRSGGGFRPGVHEGRAPAGAGPSCIRARFKPAARFGCVCPGRTVGLSCRGPAPTVPQAAGEGARRPSRPSRVSRLWAMTGVRPSLTCGQRLRMPWNAVAPLPWPQPHLAVGISEPSDDFNFVICFWVTLTVVSMLAMSIVRLPPTLLVHSARSTRPLLATTIVLICSLQGLNRHFLSTRRRGGN